MEQGSRNHWNIGRVLGPRGLHGEVRVRLLRAEPLYLELGRVTLTRDGEGPVEYGVQGVEWLDGVTARVSLRGVPDRTAAEALEGAWVGVEKAWLPPDVRPPAEALIGGTAVEDGAGTPIGPIRAIFDNGAHLVLVIGEGAQEVLVPLVDAFVVRVEDCPQGPVVHVRAIPGLLEPSGG